MAFGDSDLQTFFADMGVPVVLGSSDTLGLLDDLEDLGLDGEYGNSTPVGIHTVLIAAGALPGLAIGSQITVAGESMEVRRRLNVEDGKLTRLWCREA